MTRILQCNLNRSGVAQNLLMQRIYEGKIDVCIISEQHTNIRNKAWFSDDSSTAAIWVVNSSRVTVECSGHGEGHVWIKIPGTYIVSVYLSPNEGISVFRQKLADIEDKIINLNGEVIIAGDFNAKSAEWGSEVSDTRGNEVADLAARLDLTILNTGNSSTFRRPGYRESILDISMGTPGISSDIRD